MPIADALWLLQALGKLYLYALGIVAALAVAVALVASLCRDRWPARGDPRAR
jgi:hypothetical protein